MDWNALLSSVLQAVLIAILPPLVVALVKFLQKKAEALWAEAQAWSPTVTDLLEQAAVFAVVAAEQAGASNLITSKKEYAIEVATDWLLEHGVDLNITLVSAAVEKAVLEYFHTEKFSEPAVG